MNYYNENSDFPAQWLQNLIKDKLIPDGYVDTRSIEDVQPDDLAEFSQCHFFAGIGGWSLALSLAGWPEDREIWSLSCPCQPFSISGRGLGVDDPRHLWPYAHRLIRGRRPAVIMGEQVAGEAGLDWFGGVAANLEEEDYQARAVVLPACSIGARHVRPRIYWVADTLHEGLSGLEQQRNDLRSTAGKTSTVCGDGGIFEGFCNLSDPGSIPEIAGLPRPVGEVKAYGNAILPPLAAEVIKAYMECRP